MSPSRRVQRSFLLSVLKLMIGVSICAPYAAHADCSGSGTSPNDNPSTCVYVAQGQTVTIQPEKFQIPDGNSTPACEQVTNNNCPGGEIMVPTFSFGEWSSFLTAVGNGSYPRNSSGNVCLTLTNCPTAVHVALTASSTTVLAGSPSTLNWTITGATGKVTCTATSTDSPSTWPKSTYFYSTVPSTTPTGTASVTPNPSNSAVSTTYTLTCVDSLQGSGTGSVTVNIGQPLTVKLSANPTSVTAGDSTIISYSVTDASNLAFQCAASATDSDAVWTGSAYVNANASLSGSTAVTPAPLNSATSVTYYLNCSDSLQNSVQQSVDVQVTSAAVNGQCGTTQYTCTATGGTVDSSTEKDSNGTSTWTCDGSNNGTNATCSICDSGYSLQNGTCVANVTACSISPSRADKGSNVFDFRPFVIDTSNASELQFVQQWYSGTIAFNTCQPDSTLPKGALVFPSSWPFSCITQTIGAVENVWTVSCGTGSGEGRGGCAMGFTPCD